MSLILEALRKSEAERRRGQVPDLHASPAADVPLGRDGAPAWLRATLAVAAALVLAIVVWLGRDIFRGAPANEAPPEFVVAGAAEPDDGNRTTGAAPPAQMPRPQSSMTLLRPDQDETLAGTGDTPAREPEADPAPSRQQPPATPPIPAETVAPPPRMPGTTRASRASPTTLATVEPSPRNDEADSAVSEVDAAAPATIVAAAAPSAQSPAMPLSDLPVSQREKLPPLRMSMHMWAPTQRFAIIDGARVSEGDRVGDAVVEAITSDGVILAWQGQRLHVPVR